MPRFPRDAPAGRVVAALERLGFVIVRSAHHVSMERANADGTKTPLTMPNHRTIKGSTLRTILSQSGIARGDFLKAYDAS